MTKKDIKENHVNDENKFEKEQPLRHSLTKVILDEENQKLRIGNQIYKIMINKFDAIDIDLLRKKYDPYLDQYDFLVGDVSSDHLRLKGFYKDNVRTSIDKKQRAIADYLTEYCNPGSAYFVLQLIVPVHHYTNSRKYEHYRGHYKKHYAKKNLHNNFKKRKVRSTKFKKQKTVAVKKENSRHAFVIKKKRKSE